MNLNRTRQCPLKRLSADGNELSCRLGYGRCLGLVDMASFKSHWSVGAHRRRRMTR